MKANIKPSLEEFLEYAKGKLGSRYPSLKPNIELTYYLWEENGWRINRKGKLEKIQLWKPALLNTLRYLTPVYTENKVQIAD